VYVTACDLEKSSSFGVVCMILRLAVLIQYWRVIDGQTDRQTQTDDGQTHDDN